MPRRPSVVPSTSLHLMLPLDLMVKLNASLYSELEQRVPFGEYQRFFIQRIKEFFYYEKLDLAPYLGVEPGLFIISGSPASIEILKKHFTTKV